ncbi:ssDNA endodeoxyribonuclease [Cladochytrium tenue]|nr:ssDNA endodeoxyribonuclease [Cladochytrium tenue]
MEFPKNADVLQTFSCTSAQTYDAALIQPALKSLSLSSKTSIRINVEGFMSMQFMVPISDAGDVTFVEFLPYRAVLTSTRINDTLAESCKSALLQIIVDGIISLGLQQQRA